jgi:DNA invertase Pin-like site-specific DNA recombinase
VSCSAGRRSARQGIDFKGDAGASSRFFAFDCLARSLSDFAKIVEVFGTSGPDFVSVTQQFSMAASMGRLTSNMLLSFAQFEREVTGNRIRDKVAASARMEM